MVAAGWTVTVAGATGGGDGAERDGDGMEIKTRPRLTAAPKNRGTRAGAKARAETAFDADAFSVAELLFLRPAARDRRAWW